VGAAFTAKYGVKFLYVRISSSPLMQRFSAESESGNIAADIAWIAGGVGPFSENAVKRGWVEPVSQAGLPVLKGEFPAKFMRPNSAVVQVAPWGITYHTERLKGAAIPKEIKEILEPRFKGQILIPDPRSSDVYLGFWGLVLDKYGEGFFKQLLALEPRRFASGVPAVQALGAGEGLIEIPAVPAQVLATKSTGAPVDISIPALTTGLEMEVVLTARSRAKHPNAARLLANYVMSQEGNKVFNDDPGGVTVYDTSGLPKQYEAPKEGTGVQAASARREQLTKLLGF
jgi:iron(III) transport system substrate-binding protein